MADIASEVNLSVGNLYFYFKNKDALFIAVLLEASKRSYAVLNAGYHSAKAKKASTQLEAMFTAYLDSRKKDAFYQEVFTDYISRVVGSSRSAHFMGITDRMKKSRDYAELQKIQWMPAGLIISVIQEGKSDGSITCSDSSLLIFVNIWAMMIGRDSIYFPELENGIPELGVPPLNLEAWGKSSLKMILSYLQS